MLIIRSGSSFSLVAMAIAGVGFLAGATIAQDVLSHFPQLPDTAIQLLEDRQTTVELPQQAVVPSDLLGSDREITEILELRKSLGGGVISILGDLENAPSKQKLQEEFEAGLARLVLEGRSGSKPIIQGRPSPQASLPPVRSRLSAENLRIKVTAIRRVSKQLEQLAWDLEEIDAFEEADRLRQQAADLRQQARQTRLP